MQFNTRRFDYCNALLAGQPPCLTDRLQSVQNAAVRLYAGVSKFSHITDILRDGLHWLRIPQRINYKICTLVFGVYKAMHHHTYLSIACGYNLLDRLDSNINRASRNRSAALGNLVVSRSRTMTYGQRSFRVAGPNFWNALSQHLKVDDIPYITFKSQLKTHFKTH